MLRLSAPLDMLPSHLGDIGAATGPTALTLGIEGLSSSRLGQKRLIEGRTRELLRDAPDDVRVQRTASEEGHTLLLGHNGYARSHGLTHVRRLELSGDVRARSCEQPPIHASPSGSWAQGKATSATLLMLNICFS